MSLSDLFLTAFIDRVEYDTFDILQDEEVKQPLATVILNNCMCIMQRLTCRCQKCCSGYKVIKNVTWLPLWSSFC